MGKLDLREGVLSGSLHKLTGVVSRTKSFVRSRVIPHDPKSVDQLAYRDTIRALSQFAKKIYQDILLPYTLPKATPFNNYMHANSLILSNKDFKYSDLMIFEGSLYNPGVLDCHKGAGEESVVIHWITAKQGEAQSSDVPILLAYNEEKDTAFHRVFGYRLDSERDIAISDFDQGDHIHCYLAFHNNEVVSSSGYGTFVWP